MLLRLQNTLCDMCSRTILWYWSSLHQRDNYAQDVYILEKSDRVNTHQHLQKGCDQILAALISKLVYYII